MNDNIMNAGTQVLAFCCFPKYFKGLRGKIVEIMKKDDDNYETKIYNADSKE